METFIRYVLKDGKLGKIEVPKEVAFKEPGEVLEEYMEFLGIMEKL